jgi:DNA-binding MarR family transcriptional regulator
MAGSGPEKLENILNSFAEVMSMILLDLHQQHLAELDLTLPQAQVLRVLRRSGALPTGRLAAELRISAPAVTQLTDRLIRKGLIERQTATGDRRSVLVGLSAKGKRLIDQFRKRRRDIFCGALAQLDEKERTEVMAALGKVLGALEQYEAKLAIQRAPSASKGERKQKAI